MSTQQHKENGHAHEAGREKIKGVFSTQVVSKVGTGTTMRKTIQKMYWFAEELDSGEVSMQPLNVNYVPSGPKKVIPKDEMLEKFSPEPEFYVSTVFPKMKELGETITRADQHRQRGEQFSAEFEYKNVLQVDEENVKANFGLGLTYLDRGQANKADDIFKRLVKLDAAFEQEHKHLFNDFGIQLRKNKMCDQAVEYYKRALELSGSDENLHYNMARAWFEKKDMAKTREHLEKALELNPELEAARQFMDWLKKKGHLG
ncbi:MAG: tetratricopeptide repeat protein [Desulfovibrionaceae bacterium]|jgi:tetratricopeptide (TPR) repeat protein|nr:tetratricopeptide repeat protein [Desulfovibrionaceae bacterium]